MIESQGDHGVATSFALAVGKGLDIGLHVPALHEARFPTLEEKEKRGNNAAVQRSEGAREGLFFVVGGGGTITTSASKY